MLTAHWTENNLGLYIRGEQGDLEALYDALHVFAGYGYDDPQESPSCLRILGLAYDVRHAMMGHRDTALVDNGLEPGDLDELGSQELYPEKNFHWQFPILWPEIVFVLMALQQQILAYAGVHGGEGQATMHWPYSTLGFDRNLAAAAALQSAVDGAVRPTLTQRKRDNLIRSIASGGHRLAGFMVEYVDYLNLEFINMTPQKRRESINWVAARLSKQDGMYVRLKREKRQLLAGEDRRRFSDFWREKFPQELDWRS